MPIPRVDRDVAVASRIVSGAAAWLVVAPLVVLLAACATTTPTASGPSAGRYELRLLGVQTLPHRQRFGDTVVGGLSGIDRDPATDVYYLISDDRSRYSPNRFYTARLAIDEHGFHDATLQTVVTLRTPDGHAYAPDTADSEAIRFDPRTGTLWWTSEGMRKVRKTADRSRLVDPFVRRATPDGSYVDEVPLDPMFHITTDDRGPRDNLVFEGLTLSVDGNALYVSMEAPLLQDGPMSTMTDGAWSRISRYDRKADGGFGALAAQFAYRIDPIPSARTWTSSHAQTGVSEILATDATHLFVLERAFVLGPSWRIRLFEADMQAATDVKAIDSLADAGAAFVPTTKTLVLDFDTVDARIDNLEGMCFGPTLPNGHRTIVFVSDDNFEPVQVTELLAFEIVPLR